MKIVLLFQGLYYLVTAIWPLVDIDSFMFVTGPKTDIWLVKTCAGLIVAIALTLVVASALVGQVNLPVVVLALTSSLILSLVDVYYTSNNIIPMIYLLDAVIEITFIFLVILVLVKQTRERHLQN